MDVDNGRLISSPTSILTAVGQMKRYVSKKIGADIWQRSFHDHVIREKTITKNIEKNLAKWQYDCFYTSKKPTVGFFSQGLRQWRSPFLKG